MVEQGTEEQWIRESQAGDSEAFAFLVARYQKMIHALTFRMTGSLADSDDLAQETFLRAFKQLDSYRGKAKFSSWLYRIAVNRCLNWRKSESRRQEVHNLWAGQDARDTAPLDHNPVVEETGRRVQDALLRLPAKQRAAIVVTVYQGLSQAEAAQALGCSESTVAWRSFAARSKLKGWLRTASPGGHND